MSDDKKSELNVLQLRNLAEVISRMRLSGMLGQSFQGNRDLYSVLGYKKDLVFQDYMLAYRRGSLGKRIINAPVDATWFGDVAVYENQEDEETEFEKKWKELNKKHNIIAKLNRFDKLVGMGQYAILLLGFNDGKDLPDPLEGRASDLIYLQPYHEGNCQIVEWEIDEKNPRYGRPNKYSIKLIRPGIVGEYKESRVHWTRAIHTAGECLENDVLGLPRMESCFNRLSDIDKLAGGSAEMFWQGALGGKAFSTKEGATLDSQTAAAMGEEIDEYIHGLRRYMRLQNMDVQNLSPDLISSPKDYLDIQLDLLAGDTGIPKRILVGSERGELASTQDESNWLTRIEQRRIQFAEPFIMRPFVDRLIEVGVLPEPKDGYQVDWPDLWSMSDQEQATVSKTRTETIAAYVNAPGIEAVIPEEFFLEEVVGFTREQVDRIEKMLEENPPEEIEEVVEPGGGESGKKSQDSKEAPIDNFNPYHDARGRFASAPGGGLAVVSKKSELPSTVLITTFDGGEEVSMATREVLTDIYNRFPAIAVAFEQDPFNVTIVNKKKFGSGREASLADYNPYRYEMRLAGKGHSLIDDTYQLGNDQLSVSRDFKNTIRHEMGHRVYEYRRQLERVKGYEAHAYNTRFLEAYERTGRYETNTISRYAGTNIKEFISETFSVYTHPAYKRGDLPRDVESIFDDMLS